MKAPIAVALDAPNRALACDWAQAIEPHVSTVKIGLELFVHYGPAIVEEIREAAPSLEVFLDLKLHDIPNTVAGAARAVAGLAPSILTVHASGSSAMIKAAVDALPQTHIAAVTVLTSLTDDDLQKLNWKSSRDQAGDLATIAVAAGARALVCSPQEVAEMRRLVGAEIRLITPGVRPAGASLDDQSRVATPQQALHDGADLLVIGRPITGAYETGGLNAVQEAAARIAESIR